MNDKTKSIVAGAIDYTRYDYDPAKLGLQLTFDPYCLEETSAAFAGEGISDYELLLDFIDSEFPGAIFDSDGDGYAEIDSVVVEVAAGTLGLRGPFPLAALFVDEAPSTDEVLIPGYEFTAIAKHSQNPLMAVRDPLADYLRSIGVHAGVDSLAVKGVHSDSPWHESGFSVDGEGRLRIDCGVFSEIALEALGQIPGFAFSYIDFDKEDGNGHRMLLVSDGEGRHLIVDNSSTSYFEIENPKKKIFDRYHCDFKTAYRIPIGSKKKPTLLFKSNPCSKDDDYKKKRKFRSIFDFF